MMMKEADMADTHRPEPPPAFVTLRRCRDVNLWVVAHCPLCGQKHVHGGGSLDGDPRELLRHRVPHCCWPHRPSDRDIASGYTLVEDTEQTDAFSAFLAARCVQGPTYRCTSAALYAAYAGWAKGKGEKPESKRAIDLQLDRRGFIPTPGAGGTRIWRWLQPGPARRAAS